MSSAVFAMIHAATDPWLNLNCIVVAASLAIVTWRTGGIEVAVVVHAVNNTFSFLFSVAVREDLADSLADRSVGAVAAAGVLPSMGAVALVVAVVWLCTRRTGPARTARHPSRPGPGTAAAVSRQNRQQSSDETGTQTATDPAAR